MLSLRIHLDDDSADPLLATLLRRAGHDVVIPSSLGIAGENDPVHLARAIRNRRILLSGIHEDFDELHDLVLASMGHHPGILVVRKDNDKKRDMNPHAIVRAVVNLCASATPLADMLHVLNHWR
ncbi:MAG TPA: DUF5615 family PIN-like protein [Tepidisphaeraceae bacterium]|nr:DUF5615 family PIN-like protein [Tepidisphaeraceae bacterium]